MSIPNKINLKKEISSLMDTCSSNNLVSNDIGSDYNYHPNYSNNTTVNSNHHPNYSNTTTVNSTSSLSYSLRDINNTSSLVYSINNDVNKLINRSIKIKDIEILVPNKVVKVVFNDDSFEKAVCHEDDEFNLETAIIICLAKHLLGGSAKFNNIITKGIKLFNDKIKAEEEIKKEQERIEAKRKKKREKLIKRITKREQEARQARILELAEAIKLADDYSKIAYKD